MDGVKDGLIENPLKCGFGKDPSALLCKGSETPACLTAQQLQTLKDIYDGYRDPRGQLVYPGYVPGDELDWKPFTIAGGSADLFTDHPPSERSGFSSTSYSTTRVGIFLRGTTIKICRSPIRSWPQ